MAWITFENFYFLFLLAVTLHSLEEAVWLPDWSQQAGRWHQPVEKIPFSWQRSYDGVAGGKAISRGPRKAGPTKRWLKFSQPEILRQKPWQ